MRSLLADRQAWQQWQQRLGPAPAPTFALLPGVPSFAQLPSAEAAAAAPAQRAGAADAAGGSAADGGAGAGVALAAAAAAGGGGDDPLDGLLRCAPRDAPRTAGVSAALRAGGCPSDRLTCKAVCRLLAPLDGCARDPAGRRRGNEPLRSLGAVPESPASGLQADGWAKGVLVLARQMQVTGMLPVQTGGGAARPCVGADCAACGGAAPTGGGADRDAEQAMRQERGREVVRRSRRSTTLDNAPRRLPASRGPSGAAGRAGSGGLADDTRRGLLERRLAAAEAAAERAGEELLAACRRAEAAAAGAARCRRLEAELQARLAGGGASGRALLARVGLG